MQRLLRFPCRWSVFNCPRVFIHDSNSSNSSMRMGLPYSFDENKALDYFNSWRKSFWLAPSDWKQTSVTITQRYLPCWLFSLKGKASADAYVKSGSWLWGGPEWHPLSDPISLSNINLSNILVYAAHTYDRQHIVEIDMKVDDKLQSIDRTSIANDDRAEEWTIDRDTAFEIGWNLTIVKKLQSLFLQQLNQQQKKEYQFTSMRFPIEEETQELIYYPIYIVDYQYRNRQLQCLINGRTGEVAGLRQFSRLKVIGSILGVMYPAGLMSLVSSVSFLYYIATHRFIIVPFFLLATGISFPFVTMLSLQIGRYIRDYSHLYRGKRDIREWIDFKRRNPYFFADQESDQKRTEEPRKPSYSFNIGPDLYSLLGVSRVASTASIKQAYLLKVKEFHPDRNPGKQEIEEKFKLINQAYAILSDPEQRQIFDEYGYEHVKYK